MPLYPPHFRIILLASKIYCITAVSPQRGCNVFKSQDCGTRPTEDRRQVKTVPCTILHCNGNSVYIFLFWELCGLSPNFHIHVSVSDLYIPRILQQNRLTDTWIWKLGLRPRYSFSGNICFKFSAFCLCSVAVLSAAETILLQKIFHEQEPPTPIPYPHQPTPRSHLFVHCIVILFHFQFSCLWMVLGLCMNQFLCLCLLSACGK